jgi:hypothetical protein
LRLNVSIVVASAYRGPQSFQRAGIRRNTYSLAVV